MSLTPGPSDGAVLPETAPVSSASPTGSSSAPPMIRLEGVTKTYGRGEVAVHALRGVDLTVPAGQFVVVLGPSGSGKTTLLDLLGGIESPTSGQVEVAGRSLSGLDDHGLTDFRRETVGFVFQFFNLIPTLTAMENVELVAELIGSGRDAAAAALEAVGLAGREDHFPSALSGGEQQRVAIARALVKDPRLILADEPTGSLDLETGRQVLGVLHALATSGGRTVVLVTHNSAIARIADRVVRVRSGEIVEDVVQAAPIRPEEVTW